MLTLLLGMVLVVLLPVTVMLLWAWRENANDLAAAKLELAELKPDDAKGRKVESASATSAGLGATATEPAFIPVPAEAVEAPATTEKPIEFDRPAFLRKGGAMPTFVTDPDVVDDEGRLIAISPQLLEHERHLARVRRAQREHDERARALVAERDRVRRARRRESKALEREIQLLEQHLAAENLSASVH